MTRRPHSFAPLLLLTTGLAALGSLQGCGGDDEETPSQGYAGSATSGSGGSTSGAAGSTAGKAGSTTAGSAGSTAGNAGTGGGGAGGTGGAGAVLPGPSRGAAIAMTPNDTVAVVANRDAGSVTVVSLDFSGATPKLTKKAEVDLGAGSQPWQVAVAPDGKSAYAVLRGTSKLVRIDGLDGTPVKGPEVAVGSEPTGLAVTPTGARVWVANWVDGTVTGVDPSTMTVTGSIDLNAALVGTGLLGSVTARPALAHPRSIAITNDGDADDGDETMLVTEYFGQRTKPEGTNGADADTAKKGLVYKIALSDKAVSVIDLAPMDDIGFKDQKNGQAGCFPNQVQGVTIEGGRAYVVSICASPKGPIGPFTGPSVACLDALTDCPGGVAATCVGADLLTMKKGVCSTQCADDAACGANGGKCDLTTFKCAVNAASVKTATSPVVHVLDVAAGTTLGVANLNKTFSDAFDTKMLADDASRRFPLVADDIAVVPGTQVAYVTANGTDAVFRVKYDGTGAITEAGSTAQPFINLAPPSGPPAGRGPVGNVITNLDHGGQKFLLTANDITRSVSIVDLNTQAPLDAVPTAALPTAGSAEEQRLRGKRFFNTGLGRWSLKGQGWGSCQSCHIDGLTDNVTWYFARGPRQSTSIDGSYSSEGRRVFNWTAIFDEMSDFEGNTRGVSGGVGAIVSDDTVPIGAAQRIDLAAVDVGGAKQNHNGLSGSSMKVSDPANPLGIDKPSKLGDWKDIDAYANGVRAPHKPSNLDQAKVDTGRALFMGANCQGCHGGAGWTISKVFYDPTLAATDANKTTAWTPPAGFPASLVPAATPANRFMRFGGANPAAFDQLQCILRPVGTFGVGEAEVGVAEVRVDMTTPAQGNEPDGKGYNPPSLVGMATGAPYFHAGNARTLEAAFSSTFAEHAKALSPNFLDDDASGAKREALVQFLLSIDDDTQTIAIPAAGATGGNFCQ